MSITHKPERRTDTMGRSTGISKIGNEYAAQLGRMFDEMPKTVLAAIAVSCLSQGGDYLEKAQARAAREWQVLHENGIVQQRPGKCR